MKYLGNDFGKDLRKDFRKDFTKDLEKTYKNDLWKKRKTYEKVLKDLNKLGKDL